MAQRTASHILLVLMVGLCFSARAQETDSTEAPSSLVSPVFASDREVFDYQHVQSTILDFTEWAGDNPHVFHYDFGEPGWPDGLSMFGDEPEQLGLTVDGIPFTDLFTERARLDLAPASVLGVSRDRPRFGRSASIRTRIRPFDSSVPVTELKYQTGTGGLQYISATHAQRRRAPQLIRSQGGQLGITGNVSGQRSTGLMSGGALSNWQAFGRITLSRPDFALALTEMHTKHSAGARDGVQPSFPDAYNPTTAVVLDPNAQRETVRNNLSLRLVLPLQQNRALSLSTYWIRQHERYTAGLGDTLETKGNRFGGQLLVPFQAGMHSFEAGVSGWLDGSTWGKNNPLLSAQSRTQVHAHVRDTLSISEWNVRAELGTHLIGDRVFPTGSIRIDRRGSFAQVSYSGDVEGRAIVDGYNGVTRPVAASSEKTVRGEAGLQVQWHTLRIRAGGYLALINNPRHLVVRNDSLSVIDSEQGLQRSGGFVGLSWREHAQRGIYVVMNANTSTVLNESVSSFHEHERDAMPSIWGSGRLGLKAVGVFDGSLDIDLSVCGRAWSAFGGRVFAPSHAIFALPDPTNAVRVPASGTADLALEATLQQRARLFLVYENALAGSMYDGAYTIPVHPIPRRRIRFGIFWTLLG